MNPINRSDIKRFERDEEEAEKTADQVFGFIVGVLCIVGTAAFIYAFSSTLFALFCE